MYTRDLQRIMDRAGIEGEPHRLHRLGYEDRVGATHLPLETGVMIARAFAAVEPEMVLMAISDRESELKHRGNQPGSHYLHDVLRERMPAFAIARQWCGLEQEAETLRQEIARLRLLVNRAAYDLQDAGKERKGQALLRALDGL
jgi:hypothetical protein